jgi:uncharacterized protein YndB with AHSA1/START domain
MASTFVYVTYIRTTPAKLWEALVKPEFTRQYLFGSHFESDWKTGAPWKLVGSGGRVDDAGEILEIEPPKRLVLKWRNEFMPERKAEGYTRCTFDIVPQAGFVELKVTHEAEQENSKTIAGVSRGWPRILAGLKSLLETGRPLESAERSVA